MRVALIAGLVVLASCAAPQPACSLRAPAASIAMFRLPLDIIPVTFDRRTVPFILDTGAFETTLSPEAAASLGFKRPKRAIIVRGAAGPTLAYLAGVRTLRLGNGTLHNGLLLVTPLYDLPLSKFPVYGLLGIDILSNWAFDLDTPDERLGLYNEEPCTVTRAPFQPAVAVDTLDAGDDDAHVRFPIMIGGRVFKAVLDTGAAKSAVGPSVNARLRPDLIQDRQVEEVAIGHRIFAAPQHRFEHVLLGGAEIGPIDFLVNPKPLPTVDVVLGEDFLHRFRIFVSIRQHRLFFEPVAR